MQVLFDVHEVLSCLIDACRAGVLYATHQPDCFTHGVPGTQNPFEITRVLFFVSSYIFQMGTPFKVQRIRLSKKEKPKKSNRTNTKPEDTVVHTHKLHT